MLHDCNSYYPYGYVIRYKRDLDRVSGSYQIHVGYPARKGFSLSGERIKNINCKILNKYRLFGKI